MAYHAKRSPSGAKRWSTCTASIGEEAGRKDTAGSAAEWGTAAHLLSETCLIDEFGMTNPVDFLGQIVIGWIQPKSSSRGESIHTLDGDLELGQVVLWSVPIDQELVDCATKYVDFVRDLVSTTSGTLHVEVKVPIDHITGEEGATGTSDAVIDAPSETIVGDLKGGMLKVDAWELGDPDLFTGEPTFKPNPQLAMYADGALTKLRPDLLAMPDHPVRLIIVQPRLNHISEHRLTVGQLLEATDALRQASMEVDLNPTYRPSEDACRFCKANGDCKGQRDALLEGFTVPGDAPGQVQIKPAPEDGEELAKFYELVPLLMLAAKGCEKRVRQRLESGQPVGGYFLGKGKMGQRAWNDPAAAEELATKTFRLKQDEAYNREFKSPAQMEGVLAAQPKRWKKMELLITQKHGAPTIEPPGSKREKHVATASAEGFVASDATPAAAAQDDTGFASA